MSMKFRSPTRLRISDRFGNDKRAFESIPNGTPDEFELVGVDLLLLNGTLRNSGPLRDYESPIDSVTINGSSNRYPTGPRMSSNWLASTSYYLMELFGIPVPYAITNLRSIR